MQLLTSRPLFVFSALLVTASACSATSGSPADGGAPVDSSVIADAAPDVSTPDTAVPDASVDTGADSAVDAAPDAGACAKLDDGKYTWGVWTCGSGARTTDIKAFAIGLGIGSVEQVITGSTGVVHSIYAGTPACSRITELAIAYPSCGVVTSTTSANYTCSATCDPGKCTAGTQAVSVDTYSIKKSGDTVTETRTLDAAFLANVSLQKAAGCQAGDLETGTFIKIP